MKLLELRVYLAWYTLDALQVSFLIWFLQLYHLFINLKFIKERDYRLNERNFSLKFLNQVIIGHFLFLNKSLDSRRMIFVPQLRQCKHFDILSVHLRQLTLQLDFIIFMYQLGIFGREGPDRSSVRGHPFYYLGLVTNLEVV